MRKLTIGIVIILEMFLLPSSVKGTSFSVSYTGFLTPGDIGVTDNLSIEPGDIVYWDYRTFDNNFIVTLNRGPTYLSYNKTSDNGYYGVIFNGFIFLYLTNIDTTESGSYELNINVNPPTLSPSISGFNLFIVIGLIGLTTLIIKKKFSKQNNKYKEEKRRFPTLEN